MRPFKIVLVAIALGVVALLYVLANLNSNDPAQLIERAETGSEPALTKLESLVQIDELDRYSDAIGQAATRIAQSKPSRFDAEDPLVIRWQRLFLETDPIANASEETRLAFAQANVRLELVGPSAIDPGREHDIGVRNLIALRHPTTAPNQAVKIVIGFDNFLVDDENIFRGASQTSTKTIPPSGVTISNSATYSKVLVSNTQTPAPGTPVSLRCEVEVRLMDHGVTPPAVFAEWTEELSKRAVVSGG